jgi:hypothetical protein
MTHKTTEDLFEMKYPEFEVVGGRARVKNGTSSISITDAFFMMALHGFSIDDTLREVKEAETLRRSILHG